MPVCRGEPQYVSEPRAERCGNMDQMHARSALSHLGQYSVELMGGNNTGTICGANDPK
jgi:hypothetical protein